MIEIGTPIKDCDPRDMEGAWEALGTEAQQQSQRLKTLLRETRHIMRYSSTQFVTNQYPPLCTGPETEMDVYTSTTITIQDTTPLNQIAFTVKFDSDDA